LFRLTSLLSKKVSLVFSRLREEGSFHEAPGTIRGGRSHESQQGRLKDEGNRHLLKIML
jgi:hypothetical protein